MTLFRDGQAIEQPPRRCRARDVASVPSYVTRAVGLGDTTNAVASVKQDATIVARIDDNNASLDSRAGYYDWRDLLRIPSTDSG